jgi:hypothetical protein
VWTAVAQGKKFSGHVEDTDGAAGHLNKFALARRNFINSCYNMFGHGLSDECKNVETLRGFKNAYARNVHRD